MLKITNTDIFGWNAAIRGMRNPMNSWEKSDSYWTHIEDERTQETAPFQFFLGDNDHDLMMRLAESGSDHAKFRRMIHVQMDILAPLYWWKEFDTYKVGTVANSCSTMHKIHAKEFTLEDFSCEHLFGLDSIEQYRNSDTPAFVNSFGVINDTVAFDENGSKHHSECLYSYPLEALKYTIQLLNNAREYYLRDKNKEWWWQMIQLLPSSYNQLRTVDLNYEVLHNIYHARKNHKLDEWHTFCEWIENLPYSEVITGAKSE